MQAQQDELARTAERVQAAEAEAQAEARRVAEAQRAHEAAEQRSRATRGILRCRLTRGRPRNWSGKAAVDLSMQFLASGVDSWLAQRPRQSGEN